ncbi:MAG: hypothetical protein RRC34_05190 [Lentisphaeria bacterium]|nr:hypothetical protein [Lentisphaeria bacterium]
MMKKIFSVAVLAGFACFADEYQGFSLSGDYFGFTKEYGSFSSNNLGQTSGRLDIDGDELDGDLYGGTLSYINKIKGMSSELSLSYRTGEYDGDQLASGFVPMVTEVENDNYELKWKLGGDLGKSPVRMFVNIGGVYDKAERTDTLQDGWYYSDLDSPVNEIDIETWYGYLGLGFDGSVSLVKNDVWGLSVGMRIEANGLLGHQSYDGHLGDADEADDYIWGYNGKATAFVDVPIYGDTLMWSVFAEGGYLYQYFEAWDESLEETWEGYYARAGVRVLF